MGNICYTTGKEPNILKLNLTEPISKIIYIEDNKTIKDLIKICIKEIKNEQKLLKCIKEESMKLICDNLDSLKIKLIFSDEEIPRSNIIKDVGICDDANIKLKGINVRDNIKMRKKIYVDINDERYYFICCCDVMSKEDILKKMVDISLYKILLRKEGIKI
jgi:cell fate regulator YaaT (PSP1 superfamily)